MNDQPLQAIVLTNRAPIRDAIRGALKESGLIDDHISYPTKARECIAKIKERKSALLIVDWEFGTGEILEVLTCTKETQQQDTISTFLIAATMSEKIIAAGAEMGVSQIHTGDINKDKVKIVIKKLADEVRHLSPIKQLLKTVADARMQGDWSKATAILLQLMEKEPNNPRIRLELAENYLVEKKWDEAYELLKETPNSNSGDVRSMHLLAKVLLKKGKGDEAIKLFKEANVINPFNVSRLLELGNALMQLDRTTEAKQNFDDVIAIQPKNTEAKKGQGTCLLMDGEVNEALALMKDNITGSELASVFNTAAVLSMRHGKIPEGMNLYEAAEQALKNQNNLLARLYYNKGIGYYRWKKLAEAKSCFEKALVLDPQYENAMHNLTALANVGKKPAAAKTEAMVNAGVSVAGKVSFDDSIDEAFSDNLAEEDERI